MVRVGQKTGGLGKKSRAQVRLILLSFLPSFIILPLVARFSAFENPNVAALSLGVKIGANFRESTKSPPQSSPRSQQIEIAGRSTVDVARLTSTRNNGSFGGETASTFCGGVGEKNSHDDVDLAILTGASENHFKAVLRFLENWNSLSLRDLGLRVKLFVSDLGLSRASKTVLLKQRGAENNVTFCAFDFSRYPAFFQAVSKDGKLGEYAWKPVIIRNALVSLRTSVLWVDSGAKISPKTLRNVHARLRQASFSGIVSVQAVGTMQRWVHPETVARLAKMKGVPASEWLQRAHKLNMCAAGFVGFNVTSHTASSVAEEWYACALRQDCIAPVGSSRGNHRQDMAALTVLLHFHGVAKQCGRFVDFFEGKGAAYWAADMRAYG